MPKERGNKVYVVFRPITARGVYSTWDECSRAVRRTSSAEYCSVASPEQAKAALSHRTLKEWREHVGPENVGQYLAVDAARSSNGDGLAEYRGVLMPGKIPAFSSETPRACSNNVAEFLALATGLRWAQDRSLDIPVYSDSAVAMGWVLGGRCLTDCRCDPEVEKDICSCESWLATTRAKTALPKMRKWDTRKYGEIPADYGRK